MCAQALQAFTRSVVRNAGLNEKRVPQTIVLLFNDDESVADFV